jgi:hypothetical protein
LEDVHCQEETNPPKAGGHHSPGTLQGTAGSKEIHCLAGEVQGREGEKEKGGGATEKEEGEGKTRSSEERKLVIFLLFCLISDSMNADFLSLKALKERGRATKGHIIFFCLKQGKSEENVNCRRL